MKRSLQSLALAALLCVGASQGWAVTCTVTAVSLAFGNYDSLRQAHTDSTGNLAIACNGKPGERVAYSVALNAGAGTYSQRTMRSASGYRLSYNIYTGASRRLVWGDGNGGSIIVNDSFRLDARTVNRNYPVYGRMFRGQKVPAGIYNDAITVTLNF